MISLDLKEFQSACDFVLKHSRKTEAEVLNRGALVALIGGKGVQGAVKLTPKADLGKITRAKPAIIAHYMGMGLTRQEAQARYQARRRAKGYTAGPGWDVTIRKLGGRGVKKQSGFPRSNAAKARATRASAVRLVANLENSAPAAFKIGQQALQQGFDGAARDMRAYWTRRIQKTFNRVNAK